MIVQSSNGIHKEFIPLLVEKLDNGPNIDPINLFSMYVYAAQIKFQKFVVGITPSNTAIFKEEAIIDEALLDLIKEKLQINSNSIENFAELKYCLDELFLSITEKGVLNYFYRPDYLISSKELGELLNISRATIHRYKELGMECVEGVGHYCYPKHDAVYWSDGKRAARIQGLYQKNKIRNQSNEELIKEIKKQINHYKTQYGGNFEMVFGNVKDPYALDEPDDYFDWRDLLEDLKKLDG